MAWLLQWFIRGWIFFDANSTNRLGTNLPIAIQNLLDNVSLGGTLFKWVLPQFQQERATSLQNNKYLIELFGDGISLGDGSNIKIKYWDLVKSGAVVLVGMEWYTTYKINQNNGGKMGNFSHAIFGLIITGLSLYTFPQLIQQFKQTAFNLESLR